MANRYFWDSQHKERAVKYISGKITLDSSAAVTSAYPASAKGVASVTKTATGTYRITLQDKYNALLDIDLDIMEAVASAYQVKAKAEAVASGPTIDIWTINAGAAADVSAATTIYFSLVLKNTSVS